MTREEKCSKCTFWDFKEGQEGICRRFPPFPLIKEIGQKTEVVLPLMKKDDWCGEFKSAKTI